MRRNEGSDCDSNQVADPNLDSEKGIPPRSRQELAERVSAYVGQPEVAALELERQLRVVDAQAVQDRRVQVVDVDRVA